MGTNYYIHIKRKYDREFNDRLLYNERLGYRNDENDNDIEELKNGFVWKNTYYPTMEELNKEYYLDLHIGKSSMGWHFSLCIYPLLGINTLDDWKKVFKENEIYNEYDEKVSPEDMLDTIENRSAYWVEYEKNEDGSYRQTKRIVMKDNMDLLEDYKKAHSKDYSSYEEMLRRNHAEDGLYGLLAHAYGDYVRTEGTYDLTTDVDFS